MDNTEKAAFKQRAALHKKCMKGKSKINYSALKESAKDTLHKLEHVDPAKMTKDQFLLCGAATAILDHANAGNSLGVTTHVTPSIPGYIPYADLVNSELIDADKYWGFYERTKNEMFKHIARHKMGHAAALLEGVENKETARDLTSRLRNMEKVIK